MFILLLKFKYLGKFSGRHHSIKGIEGIFGVGEKSISEHKSFQVSLLSALHLVFEIIIGQRERRIIVKTIRLLKLTENKMQWYGSFQIPILYHMVGA